MTTLDHATTLNDAHSIMTNGFRDRAGHHGLSNHERAGVWLTTPPLDVAEGARGDAVLSVELDVPPEEIGAYEVVVEGRRYREFQMPAAMVNAHADISLVRGSDPDDLTAF
jgi:hypothetical protein